LRGLELPHLGALLARLAPQPPDGGDAATLSMPHERALARAFGLPSEDGQIPFAAWQVLQAGGEPGEAAWAHITPCHWEVARNHIVMDHPQDLKLDARESRALLAAMQPYFEQDGIALQYEAPTRWLAHGELFRGLPTASLDRVVGQDIDTWVPRSAQASGLRRLQQEMQMLLYTHPLNDERTRGGLLPVNSFWVSGTGALPPAFEGAAPAGLQITHYLRDAALLADWRGWSAAWQQLDTGECARLVKRLDAGESVTLTLCGERQAQTWSGRASAGLFAKIASLRARFGGQRATTVLENL
jgi:hypothetical protein